MDCISYKKGYKYQLTETYKIKVDIKPLEHILTHFIDLTPEGILIIRKGYAWDGCSGPTWDDETNMRAGLIHDSLYGKVDYSLILCGHHHNKFKLKELFYLNKISLIINCSCDVWNFYPVRLDEVLSIYYKWKKQREKINRWAIPEIITEMNKNYGN